MARKRKRLMTHGESVAKSYDKYAMALALLQTWEKTPDAEPAHILYLQKRVRYLHGQLVNKGHFLPNEKQANKKISQR